MSGDPLAELAAERPERPEGPERPEELRFERIADDYKGRL